MSKNFRSIQVKLLTISIMAILLTVVVIGGIISYNTIQNAREEYISSSDAQMRIVESTINVFYDQIDKDINMMAVHPRIKEADQSITSYTNTTTAVQMTPSKNGGIEQEIFEVFKLYADTHPGTMYVYFGTEDGSYLQWPETTIHEKYIPKDKSWYKTGLSGNGAIIRTEPYIDSFTKTLITSNVQSFTDSNGKILGVIGIDVQQSVISDMLANMKTGKTGYYMILHNSGIIMADGNNSENNFKNLEEVGVKGLEQLLNVELKQVPRGKSMIDSVYHLQHINSLHSGLKRWLMPFNGVSTKYISNYLAWFKFLKISKKSKNSDRIKDMLINVATKETCITINTIRNRYVELI